MYDVGCKQYQISYHTIPTIISYDPNLISYEQPFISYEQPLISYEQPLIQFSIKNPNKMRWPSSHMSNPSYHMTQISYHMTQISYHMKWMNIYTIPCIISSYSYNQFVDFALAPSMTPHKVLILNTPFWSVPIFQSAADIIFLYLAWQSEINISTFTRFWTKGKRSHASSILTLWWDVPVVR